ncbi:ABC transporter permease [Pelagibacterales bacterium SAG-MED03]|nr:ABC transporter permease [Pelagibacterales bacterium SAG-MED03]
MKNNNLTAYLSSCFELSWMDIKLRYARSILGPFWIVLSSMVLIGGLTFVFNSLWGMDVKSVVPWIAIGVIVWGFILTVVEEGSQMLINDVFNNLAIKPIKWCLIHVFKNLIILTHNSLVIFLALYFTDVKLTLNVIWVLYGIVILSINALCFSIILSFLCTRYRDFILIIRNLMFLLFLITPIFWMPNLLKGNRALLADWNIIYQLIQTIRDPLLGISLNKFNLIYTSSFTLVFIILTIFIYQKYEKKFNLWI